MADQDIVEIRDDSSSEPETQENDLEDHNSLSERDSDNMSNFDVEVDLPNFFKHDDKVTYSEI